MRIKRPHELAMQKAIVCLYLRKRHARKSRNEWNGHLNDGETGSKYYYISQAAYYEACNALESMKRVLWHNNWD